MDEELQKFAVSSSFNASLTKGKNETGLLVETGIILTQLLKAVRESVLVESILRVVALLLPCRLKLLESRECMPECWLLFRREVLLDSIRILVDKLVHEPKSRTGPRTPSISHASTTRTQSRSAILNAVHGICFTSRLLRRKVVIGPYSSSAEVKNNVIGYVMYQPGR